MLSNMAQAHVIVLDSINEDIFVCGLCKSVFNSLEVFLNHKRRQCTPKSLENIISEAVLSETITAGCSIRDATISQDQENYAEALHEAPPVGLPCTICGKMFKTRKTHGAHIKSHYMKPYQCPICGRCLIQNSHLQRHVLSHKVWPESLSETTAKSSEVELLSYSCPYCKVVLSNYNQFRSHLKDHQIMKKFKCIQGECVNFFENVESLLQHVSSAHNQPMYSCYICKKPFHSLESIATHQQTHNSFGEKDAQGKQYKCSQCDAVFKKPEKLTLHMLTENHKKMCIHCNKTFASDKRLRLHLQIHRKIKPYHCSICNSSFHMKKYLTNHMLKHGKREFKCPICKNMFKRQDLLQRHMKLHQSNNMFKCPFKEALNCKREFSRKDKLMLHVKSHSKHMAVCPSSKSSRDNNEDCINIGIDG